MIRIQNIYYMLAYAFQVLNEQGYRDIALESFENTADLCAAILTRGLTFQIKRGLGREYVLQTEPLSSPRGKIDLTTSLLTRSVLNKQLVCDYDEFTVNSYMNRIIKSTILLLLKADIQKERKKELRKLLLYLKDVEEIDLFRTNWNLNYNRNNQTYRMLISICYLVVKGLLQTNADGSVKVMDYLDEQRMSRLYEKFILGFYRRECLWLSANASQIPWQLDDGISDNLPIMQTDITLTQGNKVLIIDAKYYQNTMQTQYERRTNRSNNLYQIFTYVKNKEIEMSGRPHEVAGMLLYARTDEDTVPDNDYQMSGNKISVKTLDLNQDFQRISQQLKGIASSYFVSDSEKLSFTE